MPITFLQKLEEWIVRVLQRAFRTDSAGQVSVRTDPNSNDLDVLYSRKYYNEDIVTTVAGYVSVDFPSRERYLRIVREATVTNMLHPETPLACNAVFPEGKDGPILPFPNVTVSVINHPGAVGPAASALLRNQNDPVLFRNAMLRVYGYGAIGRTLRFSIVYDEVRT